MLGPLSASDRSVSFGGCTSRLSRRTPPEHERDRRAASVCRREPAHRPRFISEVIDAKDVEAIERFLTPDAYDHTGGISGLEATKRFFRYFFQAFPDLRYTIEDQIAESDRVALRLTLRGTHRGEFLGVAATGKAATWSAIAIYRVADGKLAEQWIQLDRLGLLQQLGAIPAPQPAP